MSPLSAAPAPSALATPDEISPLTWWRHFGPDDLAPDALTRLTALLGRIVLLHEPRWREACAGDAAAAISIALRRVPVRDPCVQDVVVSALLACALRGSPAAQVALACLLRRARVADPATMHLAARWAAHRGPPRAARPPQAPSPRCRSAPIRQPG